MPTAFASVLVMGADSSMSSAFPAGGPSRMSVRMTSASSMSTMRCAVVDPTKPLPTTVTFFLLIDSPRICSRRTALPFRAERGVCFFWLGLARGSHTFHVFDNSRSEGRGADFAGARHKTLKVVCDFLLLDSARDAVLDELCRFAPAKKFQHHRPRKHHGTRVDHVFIGVFWRGSVGSLEHAKSVANVGTGGHTQPANLRSASIRQI